MLQRLLEAFLQLRRGIRKEVVGDVLQPALGRKLAVAAAGRRAAGQLLEELFALFVAFPKDRFLVPGANQRAAREAGSRTLLRADDPSALDAVSDEAVARSEALAGTPSGKLDRQFRLTVLAEQRGELLLRLFVAHGFSLFLPETNPNRPPLTREVGYFVRI